jgi:hypothetical protein
LAKIAIIAVSFRSPPYLQLFNLADVDRAARPPSSGGDRAVVADRQGDEFETGVRAAANRAGYGTIL